MDLCYSSRYFVINCHLSSLRNVLRGNAFFLQTVSHLSLYVLTEPVLSLFIRSSFILFSESLNNYSESRKMVLTRDSTCLTQSTFALRLRVWNFQTSCAQSTDEYLQRRFVRLDVFNRKVDFPRITERRGQILLHTNAL